MYEEEDNEAQAIDPESACYIREMMEDWSSVNFIQSLNFTTVKQQSKAAQDNLYIDKQQKTNTNLGNKIVKTVANIRDFRCFNNNKIHVDYTIQLDLEIGKTKAQKCEILVVPQNTVNLLGRDTLQKQGIYLAYSNLVEKIQIIHSVQINISKWVFQKYSHLCTRIGKSKNHVAKPTFKRIKTKRRYIIFLKNRFKYAYSQVQLHMDSKNTHTYALESGNLRKNNATSTY